MTGRELINDLQTRCFKYLDMPLCVAFLTDDGVKFIEVKGICPGSIHAEKIANGIYQRTKEQLRSADHSGMNEINPMFISVLAKSDLEKIL